MASTLAATPWRCPGSLNQPGSCAIAPLCRGHYLLALAASLRSCCPLEQLQALPPPEPPSTVRPAEAAPAAADAEGAAEAMQLDGSGGSGEQAGQGPEPPAHQTPGAALRAPAVTFAAPATGALPRSAAPGTGAHATPAELAAAGAAAGSWRTLPTPATQVRLGVFCAAGRGKPMRQPLLLLLLAVLGLLRTMVASSSLPRRLGSSSRRTCCSWRPAWTPPLWSRCLPRHTRLEGGASVAGARLLSSAPAAEAASER